MANDIRGHMPRPLTLIIAVIAVVGWLVAGISLWRSSAALSAAALQISGLEARMAEGQAALDKSKQETVEAAGKLRTALEVAGRDREEAAKQLAAEAAKLADARSAVEQ